MKTLCAPCYAVIFTSRRSADQEGYPATAERMAALCEAQPGFLKMVHATSDQGESVTTCYWRDLDAIAAWKAQHEHQVAQREGIDRWYQEYRIEVARIERIYHWQRGEPK